MSLDLFREWLALIDHSRPYRAALFFYGFYPVFMSVIWVLLGLTFRRRQEQHALPSLPEPYPFVSVLVPAYNEEATIDGTLHALLALDYPAFEVIVINDCSPDSTAGRVRAWRHDPRVRLLDKQVNEGKAMALNDALPLCRGEILLVIDADIQVTPNILRSMVPHFQGTRVAAVTGNPRVKNRLTLLQNLQAIEFSSIVSMQRRAQRVWGRVLTVSGAIFAVRRSALLDVGGFRPHMATEDIDLTWRLQMKFWDVRYEPRAVVWMQVPPTLRELWKQRRRWAMGLAQVLREHRAVPRKWVLRRLWPVFYESCLSILWAYTFVLITSYWVICKLVGYDPIGASPIPNLWGMLIGTACLFQLLCGALADRKYDPQILRSFPEAIYYPLIYWVLMCVITSAYTVKGLFGTPPQLQRWSIARRNA